MKGNLVVLNLGCPCFEFYVETEVWGLLHKGAPKKLA
jgi:hypothetical protein